MLNLLNSKREMMEKMLNNKNYDFIKEVYSYISNKYGSKVVIAGGSMTDLIFDKPMYDVDCFISLYDLKSEWKKNNYNKSHNIVDVLRDEYNGLDIDIVVVSYNNVMDHINRFDMNLKRIWFDGNKIHMSLASVIDYSRKEISINTVDGHNVYFRCLKAEMKYNLTFNKYDKIILNNHLAHCKKINVSNKYQRYLKLYKELTDIKKNKAVADITEDYIKIIRTNKRRNFKLLKICLIPYIKLFMM